MTEEMSQTEMWYDEVETAFEEHLDTSDSTSEPEAE